MFNVASMTGQILTMFYQLS